MKRLKWNEQNYRNFGHCGLMNLGNTCFLNSILQCLFHVMPLTDYILTNEFSEDIEQSNKITLEFKLFYAYTKLIENVWTCNRVIVPKKFLLYLSQFVPNYSLGNQQDAMEYLTYILDAFDRCLSYEIEVVPNKGLNQTTLLAIASWKKFFERDYSIIKRHFYGQYHNRIKCSTCEKWSEDNFDPFNVLPLAIPDHSNLTLTDCLKYANDPHQVNFQCDHCKSKQVGMKKSSIFTLPNVLIIQLKRFNNSNVKNEATVQIPFDNFDMRPFLSNEAPNAKLTKILYHCIGVIHHVGGTSGGHYYSYIKHFDGSWYEMNDTTVNQIQTPSMSSCTPYGLIFVRN